MLGIVVRVWVGASGPMDLALQTSSRIAFRAPLPAEVPLAALAARLSPKVVSDLPESRSNGK